ncbi:hypothetical protein [Aromatoleum aromaticum]|uniref:hypothetical protein n=1 Tax=Aromatoleum aromaticum TaxID=551760 RepID=UPI0012FF5802|nr:hypothetical protein [Aromatoleum aromaticum]
MKFKESILQNSATTEDLCQPDIFQLWSKKENAREYMAALENLAICGNVPSQEFVSQWFIMAAGKTDSHDGKKLSLYKALKFGVLAAESGVIREALNVPITAMKLVYILTNRNGQKIDKEAESIVHLAYKWHNLNSKNERIGVKERKRASQDALEMKEAWSGLFEEELEDSFASDDIDPKELENKFMLISLEILTTLGTDATNVYGASAMAKDISLYTTPYRRHADLNNR